MTPMGVLHASGLWRHTDQSTGGDTVKLINQNSAFYRHELLNQHCFNSMCLLGCGVSVGDVELCVLLTRSPSIHRIRTNVIIM